MEAIREYPIINRYQYICTECLVTDSLLKRLDFRDSDLRHLCMVVCACGVRILRVKSHRFMAFTTFLYGTFVWGPFQLPLVKIA